LVAHGFSQIRAKDVQIDLFLRGQASDEHKYGFTPMPEDCWCQSDQYRIVSALSLSLIEAGTSWSKLACDWAIDVEEEREKFAFLKLPW